jgi:hypothetical protein
MLRKGFSLSIPVHADRCRRLDESSPGLFATIADGACSITIASGRTDAAK